MFINLRNPKKSGFRLGFGTDNPKYVGFESIVHDPIFSTTFKISGWVLKDEIIDNHDFELNFSLYFRIEDMRIFRIAIDNRIENIQRYFILLQEKDTNRLKVCKKSKSWLELTLFLKKNDFRNKAGCNPMWKSRIFLSTWQTNPLIYSSTTLFDSIVLNFFVTFIAFTTKLQKLENNSQFFKLKSQNLKGSVL